MEITIEIDDKILEEPVRLAAARAINDKVRYLVDRKINTFQNEFEIAITKYLDKTLTPEVLKSKIDNVVLTLIKERLEE